VAERDCMSMSIEALWLISGLAAFLGVVAIGCLAWYLNFSGRRLDLNSIEQNRHDVEGKRLRIAATISQTMADHSLKNRAPQWYDVRVVRIDQESRDVKSFYLVDPKGNPLPPYLAGQHVLLQSKVASRCGSESRCYTLSDSPHNGYWRISVKRNSDESTSVSRWLHDVVGPGDILRVRGPSGAFYLQTNSTRGAAFLSAGIGLTPMLPMLSVAISRNLPSIAIFAQFRDVDHLPFAESLMSLAEKHPTLFMKLYLSRFPKGVTSSTPEGLIQLGKFQAKDVCRALVKPSETDFYLCGPDAWQDQIRQELVEAGVDQGKIFFELFSEGSKTPPERIATQTGMSCSVHFRQSNRLSTFATTFPNLLGLAIQDNIPIESGCRTGACGSCMVKLLGGRVKYSRTPQYPLKPNEILPCVCKPDGDIVIDA
jgi:uncharacterized protein